MEYNAPFFRLYEAFFLKLKGELGKKGIEIWQNVMRDALITAYTKSGAKRLGGVDEFIKYVGERDRSVGLKVTFEKNDKGFIYRFHTDPFPGLKGKTNWKHLVEAYLAVKKDFFLGSEWEYTTTKHIWDGNPYTEHIFVKNTP